MIVVQMRVEDLDRLLRDGSARGSERRKDGNSQVSVLAGASVVAAVVGAAVVTAL